MSERFAHLIPFLSIAAPSYVPGAKVNITRVIEAVVIAVLTAGATTWASVRVIEYRQNATDQRIIELRDVSKQQFDLLRLDIKSVERKVDDHLLQSYRR